MGDNSGSKPKLGSLKDRIAAFNQQAASQGTPPPRPAPNPKPVQWAWKQKQVEATTSPSPPVSAPSSKPISDNTSSEVDELADKKLGMSASDAKDSIKGTLRERMAALQNQSGFGTGSPKPPVSEKPKPVKKPIASPPITLSQPVSSIPTEDEAVTAEGLPAEDGAATTEATEYEAKVEDEAEDEEEKERQRRAAIAARMARLGGARFGMAPPVPGRPTIKSSPSVQSFADEASDTSAAEPAGLSRYPD